MENSYKIFSKSLYGKVYHQRTRKITKSFSTQYEFDITNELPISELFISDFPLIIKGGYELFQDSNPYWESFATEIVAYSIIESFLIGKLGVEEFLDKTEIALKLYNNTFVSLVLVTNTKQNFEEFGLDAEIDNLCFLETVDGKSGSDIDKQLSYLVDSFLEVCEFPFTEFSQSIVLRMRKNDDLYKTNGFEEGHYLFRKHTIRVEMDNGVWRIMRKNLEERKSRIDSIVKSDQFLLRLFDIVKKGVYELVNKKRLISHD